MAAGEAAVSLAPSVEAPKAVPVEGSNTTTPDVTASKHWAASLRAKIMNPLGGLKSVASGPGILTEDTQQNSSGYWQRVRDTSEPAGKRVEMDTDGKYTTNAVNDLGIAIENPLPSRSEFQQAIHDAGNPVASRTELDEQGNAKTVQVNALGVEAAPRVDTRLTQETQTAVQPAPEFPINPPQAGAEGPPNEGATPNGASSTREDQPGADDASERLDAATPADSGDGAKPVETQPSDNGEQAYTRLSNLIGPLEPGMTIDNVVQRINDRREQNNQNRYNPTDQDKLDFDAAIRVANARAEAQQAAQPRPQEVPIPPVLEPARGDAPGASPGREQEVPVTGNEQTGNQQDAGGGEADRSIVEQTEDYLREQRLAAEQRQDNKDKSESEGQKTEKPLVPPKVAASEDFRKLFGDRCIKAGKDGEAVDLPKFEQEALTQYYQEQAKQQVEGGIPAEVLNDSLYQKRVSEAIESAKQRGETTVDIKQIQQEALAKYSQAKDAETEQASLATDAQQRLGAVEQQLKQLTDASKFSPEQLQKINEALQKLMNKKEEKPLTPEEERNALWEIIQFLLDLVGGTVAKAQPELANAAAQVVAPDNR